MIIVAFIFLVLPLVVTCVWLNGHRGWAPLFDFALTEMRVRDVGTAHGPLVGLPGRLGRPNAMGSHPGPLSFYLLAPVYRMLGGSYWALRVSASLLNAVAIAAVLAIARRRAGTAGVVGAAVTIALLELGFGLLVLTEPWNPHFPVLWFLVFLAALWSVLDGDVAMLPVAAASGSVCAQTHIPYLAVCGALGVLGLAVALVSWVKTTKEEDEKRRYKSVVLVGTVALTVLIWSPALLEQLLNKPGNLTILYDYFAHPPAAFLGMGGAVTLMLVHLDPWHIVVDSLKEPFVFDALMTPLQPEVWRGIACLLMWLAAVAVALVVKNRSLLALHGALAAALLVGVVAISRIIGEPWHYLMLWAWSVGVALILSTLSTWAYLLRRRMPILRSRADAFHLFGLALVAVLTLRLTSEVTRSGASSAVPRMELSMLVPRTAQALLAGVGPATGRDGRYLVTWDDALYGGGQGFGMVNELERRGFHVGVAEPYGLLATRHRVIRPGDATARIHLVTGTALIPRWRRTRGATQVAFVDPRTPAQRSEFEHLHEFVVNILRAAGRNDIIARFDQDLAAPSSAGNLHPYLGLAVQRMAQIGAPAAVFIAKTRRRRASPDSN